MFGRVILRFSATVSAAAIMLAAALLGCNSDPAGVGVDVSAPVMDAACPSQVRSDDLVARIRGAGSRHKPLSSGATKVTIAVQADVFSDGSASGHMIYDAQWKDLPRSHIVVDVTCGKVEGDKAWLFGDIVRISPPIPAKTLIVQILDGGTDNDEAWTMFGGEHDCTDLLWWIWSTQPVDGNIQIIWNDHPHADGSQSRGDDELQLR